jgi:oligopeptidase A
VIEYSRNLIQTFSPAKLPPITRWWRLHTLVQQPVGYGAGYYSYKWAEVLDADAFTRFRKNGVFDREGRDAVPGRNSGEGE